MKDKPCMLLIMDGYGLTENKDGNAIAMSNANCVPTLYNSYPSTMLGASGESVGLPDGQMGNSEVGHLNIGAGRIIYQELTRITKSIKDGDFFSNEELVSAIDSAVKNKKKVHFLGLLSSGGVHSHNTHLYALLELAKSRGAKNAFVHCFMDGRDVSPTSGLGFIKELSSKMEELDFGKIATVTGRYYAMDRDNRWDRVESAYDAMTIGNGVQAKNAVSYVEECYKNGVTDEFLKPCNITRCSRPVGLIEKGDTIVFYNFRPDRARQITRALSQEDFNSFERKTGFLSPNYVCFTEYDKSFTGVKIAFKKESYVNTLGEYIAKSGLTQLRIAETEKYAHVTFFFNGGVEKPNDNEERVLVPSPKVATYDLQPEMSADIVLEKVLSEIDKNLYDLIILNFANCDMVGHTGVMDAAIKAVQTVDKNVGVIVDKILSKGGSVLITADHGNAERMLDVDGSPFTAHTTNKVPFILVSENLKGKSLRDGGILADIAPTVLDVMGLEKPNEMTGKTLIK